ncbi:hypothetical protein [Pontixanthobacter sp. CEM42]|uniref:hypothetical protein n=1 Tax=Pontixanthobacter sp. CEM42 TaxID=2792077 RepID=UPI001AE09364|nr:hypothetical protein [Pontixanthobacter sp. CEM42]
MSSWREVAKTAREAEEARDNRDNRDNRANRSRNRANVPNVPNVPANPSLDLKQWHSGLIAVDEFTAPVGVTMAHWLDLIDDAHWMYENFASQAVRQGWKALDLFGVVPDEVGVGGVADRLAGARNLKMHSDVAVWSNFGVSRYYERGRCEGFHLLWELK